MPVHGQTRCDLKAIADVEAAQAETRCAGPVADEVAKVLAREAELSPQGVAVVAVVDPADQWVVLNLREDQLARFAVGARFAGRLPALDDRTAEFEAYCQAVLPGFATWALLALVTWTAVLLLGRERRAAV